MAIYDVNFFFTRTVQSVISFYSANLSEICLPDLIVLFFFSLLACRLTCWNAEAFRVIGRFCIIFLGHGHMVTRHL